MEHYSRSTDYMKFAYISTGQLQPGLYQNRRQFDEEELQSLSQSIRSEGLIEPLIIRPIIADQFEIIAGERRFRAAKMAGLEALPCLIVSYDDKQACAVTLIENIQRQDLNVMEEASGYRRLIDEFHLQQQDLAAWLGKSRSHIANLLRLLSLDKSVQELLINDKLSAGHGKLLAGLSNEQQLALAEKAIEQQWSVRKLEQEILNHREQKQPVPEKIQSPDIIRLQEHLAEHLGAPVEITGSEKNGGWLKIKYYDNDTLTGIIERLRLEYEA